MRSWSSGETPTLFTLPVPGKLGVTRAAERNRKCSCSIDTCFHGESTFTQKLRSGDFAPLDTSDRLQVQFFGTAAHFWTVDRDQKWTN